MLVVALDPDYVAALFKALDVGPDGSVALFGLDGYLRARVPPVPGMYERDYREGPANGLFANLKRAPVGSYETVSAFDGRQRLFGYRTTDGIPLAVTVSKPMAEVFAQVDGERERAFLVGGIATLVILSGLLVLLRELERRLRRERLLVETHRALTEAETLFRGIFEHATDHLFVHRVAADGSFALETLNPSASALTGLSAAEARGKRPEEVMPAAAAIVRAAIEQVIRTGLPLRRQEERVRGDGGRRFEVILLPLREPGDGRVGRVFISARDITHLRRAEERYRLLADNARDMIVQLDLTGLRLFVSPASRHLLGHEPEEIVGTRPQDEVHPEDAGRLLALIGRLSRGEAEVGISTHRLRRKDGSYVWVEGSWCLIRDESRRPAGFVASVRDVEARHWAEEALRASEARYRVLADTLPQLVWVNQELARLVLEAAGHSVDVVADGAAAVMAVEDGAFDLVLMDVQMPGMEGMTATRLIRRLKVPAATIPVIAMTANVLPGEIRQFREAGMDDHVGKPFDRAVLYATIDRWLAAPRRAYGPVRPGRAAGGEGSGGFDRRGLTRSLCLLREAGQTGAVLGDLPAFHASLAGSDAAAAETAGHPGPYP